MCCFNLNLLIYEHVGGDSNERWTGHKLWYYQEHLGPCYEVSLASLWNDYISEWLQIENLPTKWVFELSLLRFETLGQVMSGMGMCFWSHGIWLIF
jgi:hypothetical protein